MKATALDLPGLVVLTPTVHRDTRGFLVETWQDERHRAAGIDARFVQDNHSRSVRGTLRGLHYQRFGPGVGAGQAKLVRAARGRIWDVAVDLRPGSATFGRWAGHVLDDEAHEQLFIPAGFAHGLVVLSDEADVLYKLSSPYDPRTEAGIAWDDPELAVAWPITDPILSQRDRTNPSWADYRAGTL